MPPLSKRRATEPGEATAKAEPQRPKKKARANASQRRAIKKSQAEKLERETEELRVAMGGEPKDDPVIPGFTGHLTSEDRKLVKQSRRERWNTDPRVMDAIAARFGTAIALAIKAEDDEKLLELTKEYRQFVAQNQRDEIAKINEGKTINVLIITPIERRAIAAEVLDAELRKGAIPGFSGSDHGGVGQGLIISGDEGGGEGGGEPV
jgi:hypothetical protein